MGHFTTEVTGRGKNRAEAERNAIDEFLHENGHRHDVRGVENAKLLRTEPPMGLVTKQGIHVCLDYTKPNTDAPKDQWVEVWSFALNTHA